VLVGLLNPCRTVIEVGCRFRTVIFAMFDFDESGVLTLDEMVLAYRSCLSGACKVSE
jgi:hypothetical protein